MWPSINHLETGLPERFDLPQLEVLQECEAVARSLHRWVVDEVDVPAGRIEATRLSRLGWQDRVIVGVVEDGAGAAVTVAVRGRAPGRKLDRVLESYLSEVRGAVAKRKAGQEAGT